MDKIAWTKDDLLINLKAHVADVKEEYGVPSLNCVPDCDLVPLAVAQIGDVVPLGKGRVCVLVDISHSFGVREYMLVGDNLSVVKKRLPA